MMSAEMNHIRSSCCLVVNARSLNACSIRRPTVTVLMDTLSHNESSHASFKSFDDDGDSSFGSPSSSMIENVAEEDVVTPYETRYAEKRQPEDENRAHSMNLNDDVADLRQVRGASDEDACEDATKPPEHTIDAARDENDIGDIDEDELQVLINHTYLHRMELSRRTGGFT
jgi:hypothetical protein